jgi:ribonucleoside-diphosphate reductase alpha chain
MIENEEDFEVAARAGAIIGTLQASYTSFPYLGEVSERITAREALLGVSITGMMENSRVMFSPDIQRKMAEIIKEVNGEFAVELGINPAARCTCIKPAGTTSCMLGTSSGVHPHHSKRYFRRVQGNNLEAPLKFFADVNPLACEKSVWSKNGHDSILTFCIEVDDKALTKEHISAINLLKFVKLTQQNWVSAGTRLERCAQPWLRHNVSNTVSVKPEEWDEVENYIYDNREFFAGISLLPSTGDLDYPQAPFCAVSTPEELVAKYGDASIFASGLIVDGLHAFDSLWVACDTLRGINKVAKPDNPNWLNKYDLKIDWVRRAEQFADRYFSGDKGRMIYCLKEVSNWKMWCDLKREWKHVDYASLTEDSDETNLIGEAACAGGACAVSF